MGAVTTKEFTWTNAEEPHAVRRKAILDKHPEVQKLFGVEWRTCPIVLAIVILQLAIAYALRDASWGVILFLAYAVGGTLNHTLQLATHELAHNLAFHAEWKNRLLSIVANIATTLPTAITFMRYHKEHHNFQGYDAVDTDIPSVWEVRMYTNSFLKVLWVIFQPFFYAIRPLLVKRKSWVLWEVIDAVIVYVSDILILYTMGTTAFAYLLLGTFLGLGLHPTAGHFIGEHYEFVQGVETYSYYGCLNWVNFNVGYHNEHHDFPRVPWSKLPEVRKLAPEFYDHLPSHDSYIKVIWRYITDPTIGPAARIKRKKQMGKTE
jgi:sphingolipid delta-4 desaturase